jgi:hypothetical protein
MADGNSLKTGYLEFYHAGDEESHPDGKPVLNRYSRLLTKNHDFPGAKVYQSAIEFLVVVY